MKSSRPSVPSEVKRQLRQEAGFGCCNCGHPFIQYHHIVPWAEDEHFRPEDMMVVCGQCHHLCTDNAITQKDQRDLKSRPKNIVDNLVRGQLYVNQSRLVVNIAGGVAINTPNLLVFDDEVVLGARLSEDDGRVLVSANIYDSSGMLIAQLDDNHWKMTPENVWDFEVFPRRAVVRQGPRAIAFGVDVRNDKVELRGKWFYKGCNVEFSPYRGIAGNIILKGNTYLDAPFMFLVRGQPRPDET